MKEPPLVLVYRYFEIDRMPWLRRIAAHVVISYAIDFVKLPDVYPIEYIERVTKRFRLGDLFIACVEVIKKNNTP